MGKCHGQTNFIDTSASEHIYEVIESALPLMGIRVNNEDALRQIARPALKRLFLDRRVESPSCWTHHILERLPIVVIEEAQQIEIRELIGELI
jgi:hypothetical protein